MPAFLASFTASEMMLVPSYGPAAMKANDMEIMSTSKKLMI